MVKVYNVYTGERPDDLDLAHCPRLRHQSFIKGNTSVLERREAELNKLYEQYGTDKSVMDKSVAKKIETYERIIKNLKESLARTQEYMNLPNKYGR